MTDDATRLPLSDGSCAIVDASDVEMLSHWTWRVSEGYVRAYGGMSADGKVQHVRMHRVIMAPDPGQDVDHINGDGLDNRRANLRLCHRRQNIRNQRKHRNNTSGYKGVFWQRDKGKWRASISKNYRSHHLGYFTGKTEAARAYDSAARELHGEFAQLNFPAEATTATPEEGWLT